VDMFAPAITLAAHTTDKKKLVGCNLNPNA
jgi:hypothetical protein